MSNAYPELISIFAEALEQPDATARRAYLDRACGDQAGLRLRVEALLAAHGGAGHFLEPVIVRPANDSPSGGPAMEATGIHTPGPNGDPASGMVTMDFLADAKPNVIIAGRYTLQERIGEGGMGEVWVARQTEPVRRKVALKLIKQGMDSRAVLHRFEQERQALAMMDHPNIAKVLDAGLTPNGQPFFAMELVNGLPLNKFCDEARLATRDRLELFVTDLPGRPARAPEGDRASRPEAGEHPHHDHRRQARPQGHRFRRRQSNPPASSPTRSMSTQFGAIVGTLEYMSPGAGGILGRGHRHPRRHLLARRDFV